MPATTEHLDITHSYHCEVRTPEGTNCTCGMRTNAAPERNDP